MTSHTIKHEKSLSLDSSASSIDLENSSFGDNVVSPPDGGVAAWAFVAGAFVIEAVCWGFPSVSGVFGSYYLRQTQFENQDIINSIGTMATGVSSLMNPLLFYLGAKFPGQRCNMMRLGAMICVASAIGAAYSNTAILMVFTQGVGWGIGSALTITPTLGLMVEWFDARKGLAYGIMFGGSGLTGAVFPFIFGSLLESYGQTRVLLGWAVVALATLLPVTILIRGNFPLKQIPSAPTTPWRLTRTPLFVLLGAVVFLQGAVNYLPFSFLPIFGSDLGLLPWQQAFLLAGLNIATMPGQSLFGWLADEYGAYIPHFVGSVLSALVVFLLWGFARTFAVLTVFGIAYGIMTGGVTTLRSRFATALTKDCDDPFQELMMFGMMRSLGGFGGVTGGLVGSSFVPDLDRPFGSGYAGGSWMSLIMFVGVIFLVTSLGYFGKFLGPSNDARDDSKRLSVSQPVRHRSMLPQLVFEDDGKGFVVFTDDWSSREGGQKS